MATKSETAPMIRLQDRIDQSLLSARRLFICDSINDDVAEDVIKKLWYLELDDPGKPILVIINSPGGAVHAGFAIWDQLQMISSPITTLVTGIAASMASILMLASPPERRFATPKARVMIHQPLLSGVIQGQATDLEIQAREILKTKKMIIEIYMQATGKSYEEIEKAIDRDTWMTAEEAKEFRMLSKIIGSYKDLK